MTSLASMTVGPALGTVLDTTHHNYLWGLIPSAIGLANLIYYFVETRKAPRN